GEGTTTRENSHEQCSFRARIGWLTGSGGRPSGVNKVESGGRSLTARECRAVRVGAQAGSRDRWGKEARPLGEGKRPRREGGARPRRDARTPKIRYSLASSCRGGAQYEA